MSQSDLATTETTNSELHCYEQLEKHINLLGQKIRAKDKPSGFSPKFISWVKRHFILTNIVGVDLVYCIKSKKNISS
ncbi:unnamed protein product [Rotaria magnacalcarata]|uniref:Uncharacterized protein n=2 Tax=Rotaria magnacalcarata TaxID=392030 RepID=A0A816X3E7_9BILA|nr:unnamed protein product [Rotaria magnacalcarata]CAF3874497.1 unnamed protein product [Rotaria magnacalcarata]CAF3923441.1 unnamed protein product [Rotaria magnacalcarata]CAF4064862.1 unnamed protein product [Rotaria magnacalcarata]